MMIFILMTHVNADFDDGDDIDDELVMMII